MSDQRNRTAHPLPSIARELAEFDTRLRFFTGAPPGDDWLTLDALPDRELIGRLLDQSPATGMRLRNVAAAQLGASLACTVVRPMMAMLHLYDTVPVITPAGAYLHRSGYRFHDLSLVPAELVTLSEHDHPAWRRVDDWDELARHAADTLVTLFAPVLRTLRVEGRFGLGQLWGSVLDMIGATSLLVARLGKLDQQLVWSRAVRLCELVSDLIETPKVRRPTPFAVPWRGADAMFTVKGTCCLQYREYGLRAGESDHEGKAYCKTCPFITDESRAQLCASQLERDHDLHQN